MNKAKHWQRQTHTVEGRYRARKVCYNDACSSGIERGCVELFKIQLSYRPTYVTILPLQRKWQVWGRLWEAAAREKKIQTLLSETCLDLNVCFVLVCVCVCVCMSTMRERMDVWVGALTQHPNSLFKTITLCLLCHLNISRTTSTVLGRFKTCLFH